MCAARLRELNPLYAGGWENVVGGRVLAGAGNGRRRRGGVQAGAEIAGGSLLSRRQRVSGMLMRNAGDLDRNQNQRKQQRLSQATHGLETESDARECFGLEHGRAA